MSSVHERPTGRVVAAIGLALLHQNVARHMAASRLFRLYGRGCRGSEAFDKEAA